MILILWPIPFPSTGIPFNLAASIANTKENKKRSPDLQNKHTDECNRRKGDQSFAEVENQRQYSVVPQFVRHIRPSLNRELLVDGLSPGSGLRLSVVYRTEFRWYLGRMEDVTAMVCVVVTILERLVRRK